jgi:WD40 repeat protein
MIYPEALLNTAVDNRYSLVEEIKLEESVPIIEVKLKKTLMGHASNINKIIYSPNGSRLASVSDKKIKIWDTYSGACLKTLDEHIDEVTSVAYSPDGTRLASAGNNTVKIWNAENGACLQTLSGYRGTVLSVIFTPDGKSLAGWSFDSEAFIGKIDSFIQIWDVNTGTYLRTLSGPNARVIRTLKGKEFAYSPDGMKVAISIDKIIKIWDVENGACLRILCEHDDIVNTVAFSPDEKWLASGSRDKTIKIWDTESGTCLRTLNDHKDGVASVAYSSDGKSLASGSDDHTIKIWEIYEPDEHNGRANIRTGQLLPSTGYVDLKIEKPDFNQHFGIGFGGIADGRY